MTTLRQGISLIIFMVSCAVPGTTWSLDVLHWEDFITRQKRINDEQKEFNDNQATVNLAGGQALRDLHDALEGQTAAIGYLRDDVGYLLRLNKETKKKVFWLNMYFLSTTLPSLVGAWATYYDTYIAKPRQNKQQIAEQVTHYTSALHTSIPQRMQSLIEQQIKPEDNNAIKPHELCKIIQFEKEKNELLDDLEYAISQLKKITANNLALQQTQGLLSTAREYKQQIKAIGCYKE